MEILEVKRQATYLSQSSPNGTKIRKTKRKYHGSNCLSVGRTGTLKYGVPTSFGWYLTLVWFSFTLY